jgi:hypothetical protein
MMLSRISRGLKGPLGRRCCSGNNSGGQTPYQKFWEWTSQQRPSWKESKVEAAVLFTVFGITGSSSVAFVRPALKNVLGIDGTLWDGPWSYRIASFFIVTPIYACVLVTLGTLSGRHVFFANMARKIVSRFLPNSIGSKMGCPTTPIVKPPTPKAPTPSDKISK